MWNGFIAVSLRYRNEERREIMKKKVFSVDVSDMNKARLEEMKKYKDNFDQLIEFAEKTMVYELWRIGKVRWNVQFCGVYCHLSSANRAKRRLEAKDGIAAGCKSVKYEVEKTTFFGHSLHLGGGSENAGVAWRIRHKKRVNGQSEEWLEH